MIPFAAALETYTTLQMGGYQPSTWKAHRAELRRFRLWITAHDGDDVTIDALDTLMFARYLDPRRPPVLSGSTFNNYVQYLHTFIDFCRAEGWLTSDPMRHVRPAKVGRRQRLHLQPWQVRAMMDGVGARDRVALAIGYNTALRAGDIVSLSVGAVDLDAGTLTAWIQKTQTEDQFPITAELADELGRCFASYEEAAASGPLPTHWLVVPAMHYQAINLRRPELGAHVVYQPLRRLQHPERIVHRGLEILGIDSVGEGFQTLRRSSARQVHRLAVSDGEESPIRVAQDLLGHRQQSTTERYLGLAPERTARDRLMRGRRFMDG